MKKPFLLSAMLLFCFTALRSSAQSSDNWEAFYQKTDVAAYRGMKFRFHGAVKVLAGNKGTEGALWARVNRKDGKIGFFDNMKNRPVKTDKWKVYTIEGVIDNDAKMLVVGGMCVSNGVFSFDNLGLEIQDSTGNWKTIEFANAGFEAAAPQPWKYMNSNKSFAKELVADQPQEGKQYLRISGTGMSMAYGSNDSTGHYVKANGIKIYYEEYGSGEPLLLLHGNGQSIEAFSKNIPELSKYYRVIAADTRGHGKTEDKADKFTYDLFAADMNAMLNRLHLDSVNIIGWSDGGNTGLIMAMKYPQKVKKLVTMGAVIYCDSTVVTQDVLNDLRFGIEELKSSAKKEDKNDLKKLYLLRDEPNYTFSDLKAVKCPVLVMAGENDMIRAGHTKAIAAAIKGSELYIAPKYTHYFPHENAAEFDRIVLAFLAK